MKEYLRHASKIGPGLLHTCLRHALDLASEARDLRVERMQELIHHQERCSVDQMERALVAACNRRAKSEGAVAQIQAEPGGLAWFDQTSRQALARKFHKFMTAHHQRALGSVELQLGKNRDGRPDERAANGRAPDEPRNEAAQLSQSSIVPRRHLGKDGHTGGSRGRPQQRSGHEESGDSDPGLASHRRQQGTVAELQTTAMLLCADIANRSKYIFHAGPVKAVMCEAKGYQDLTRGELLTSTADRRLYAASPGYLKHMLRPEKKQRGKSGGIFSANHVVVDEAIEYGEDGSVKCGKCLGKGTVKVALTQRDVACKSCHGTGSMDVAARIQTAVIEMKKKKALWEADLQSGKIRPRTWVQLYPYDDSLQKGFRSQCRRFGRVIAYGLREIPGDSGRHSRTDRQALLVGYAAEADGVAAREGAPYFIPRPAPQPPLQVFVEKAEAPLHYTWVAGADQGESAGAAAESEDSEGDSDSDSDVFSVGTQVNR
eukprot:CAMPEP_0204379576 /NCGR_PEP_ID=MMETSP0469-20131031/52709_1 /ASSEMBLY_ACC=CAM_ASM_000384 /TAXON_ID=2969 /ORGANISM="Oxyrrhis marina" /LENGTH=487 /DNA_ID=CAMNT_0051371079 /DNA_START=169 /DNA_END=1631 /DNA_ORIENTATION=+